MSLLSEAMEPCTYLNKTKERDGYGGYITVWTDGAEFDAAIAFDDSMQARVGERQGVTNLYTVMTSKVLNLQYNDVFRRESDRKIFRVTSDGDDNQTPKSAGLDIRMVSAEEYVLPREG